jgi:transposase InsO family protein
MGMEGEKPMPWKEMDAMSLRKEFVIRAHEKGSNIRQLCREYRISSRTAYKWLRRYEQEGEAGLEDRSRRPKHIPRQTDGEMEAKVLGVRAETGWGGRKIARVLFDQGYEGVPHPNTITDILRREGKLDEEECQKHKPVERFERGSANELWQMDFKGHFPMEHGRCHALTLLDDHSRFCIGLRACANERSNTVKGQLESIFRQYGLPEAILCDNGNPWRGGYLEVGLSQMSVWLMRLGILLLHGRPRHPQTQGKDERFHRTLKQELLQTTPFVDLEDGQFRFDLWRDRYNLIRPHEALALDAPFRHYQPSQRPFPDTLPPVEYPADALVRKVHTTGEITYHDREYRVGKGLIGEYVELRPTEKDDCFDVYFYKIKVRRVYMTRKP